MGQVVLSIYRPDGTLIKEGALQGGGQGTPATCDGATFNGRDAIAVVFNSSLQRRIAQFRGLGSKKLVEMTPAGTGQTWKGACWTGHHLCLLRDRTTNPDILQRYKISKRAAHLIHAHTLDTNDKLGVTHTGQSFVILDNNGGTTAEIDQFRDETTSLPLLRTLTGTVGFGERVAFDGKDLLVLRGLSGGTGYRVVRRRFTDGENLGTIIQNTPFDFDAIGDIDWDGRNILVWWTTEDDAIFRVEL